MLAPGFDHAECGGQSFPHRVQRRFGRAIALIDRAEIATSAKKARRRIGRVGRLLGKTGDGVERLGTRGTAAPDCVAALSAMLDDGERRAHALATTF